MHARIAQVAKHADVVGAIAGFLEDAAVARDDDGVGGDDEGRVRPGFSGVVAGFGLGLYGELVDVEAFLDGGGGYVFGGGVGFFVDVFGFGGGDDVEVDEADLERARGILLDGL